MRDTECKLLRDANGNYLRQLNTHAKAPLPSRTRKRGLLSALDALPSPSRRQDSIRTAMAEAFYRPPDAAASPVRRIGTGGGDGAEAKAVTHGKTLLTTSSHEIKEKTK